MGTDTKPAEKRENTARPVQKRMNVLHAKALGGNDPDGSFEAIVSVFGVADYERDVTEPGSFAESVAAAYSPVVWSHDYMTPPIGVTVEMAELDLAQLKALVPSGVPDGATGGLYGKGRLLVNADDGEDVPLARHVWAAFKSNGGDGRPALREFSWRGAVLLETVEQRDEGLPPLYHLNKIDLVEWGPCLKGCNPETTLLTAKSMIDAGKVERARAISLLGLDIVKSDADETADDADTSDENLEVAADAEDDADDAEHGADDAEKTKGALAVSQLALASLDRPWNAAAASARVLGWAEKDDGSFDAAKLAQAHLWRDGGASGADGYRFPVVDVIAGAPRYVPKAIFAAASSLSGDSGSALGDSGVAEVKTSLDRLYSQMRKAFEDDAIVAPWADGQKQQRSPSGADPEQRRHMAALLLA